MGLSEKVRALRESLNELLPLLDNFDRAISDKASEIATAQNQLDKVKAELKAEQARAGSITGAAIAEVSRTRRDANDLLINARKEHLAATAASQKALTEVAELQRESAALEELRAKAKAERAELDARMEKLNAALKG